MPENSVTLEDLVTPQPHEELHDSHSTADRMESTSVVHFQQAGTSKRKSTVASPKTSKRAKVSNTHQQISAVAQSKRVQIDEQVTQMKAREDREKELYRLQVQKFDQELAVLKVKEKYLVQKEKREEEAHRIDMKVKEMQLKILAKQLEE